MEKLDLTRTFRPYYRATLHPELLEFDEIPYLSLTGQGDPSSQAFADKLQALYSVAYGIKFRCKAAGMDFTVPKLEGLWWFDEARFAPMSGSEAPVNVPREQWFWRLLIRMPDFVDESTVQEVVLAVRQRKNIDSVEEVHLFRYREGTVVQVLHEGPFANEPESLRKIEVFMNAQGLQKAGLHHEIYLSDFRKTPPDRLKTILREPVK